MWLMYSFGTLTSPLFFILYVVLRSILVCSTTPSMLASIVFEPVVASSFLSSATLTTAWLRACALSTYTLASGPIAMSWSSPGSMGGKGAWALIRPPSNTETLPGASTSGVLLTSSTERIAETWSSP